jgi:hypothetical protein
MGVSLFAPLLQYLKQCTSIQSVELARSRDFLYYFGSGGQFSEP